MVPKIDERDLPGVFNSRDEIKIPFGHRIFPVFFLELAYVPRERSLCDIWVKSLEKLAKSDATFADQIVALDALMTGRVSRPFTGDRLKQCHERTDSLAQNWISLSSAWMGRPIYYALAD